MKKDLIEELVRQAFSAQNKKIDLLENELNTAKLVLEETRAKIGDLIELNCLMDKEITKIREFVGDRLKNSGEEIDLMEDYKFGTDK